MLLLSGRVWSEVMERGRHRPLTPTEEWGAGVSARQCLGRKMRRGRGDEGEGAEI